jgi:CelD/BcsL family acetyltransferase involved in cellulose biosynthesis
MAQVLEINQIDQLPQFRHEWGVLLSQTAGASFFQSLDWLEVYWRHFGQDQTLRVLVVLDEDRPTGVLPLVVRREATRVGRLRVLTFPLHDWGSFYGPIGPDPARTLASGLEHIRQTRRDWDILELRWLGAPGTDPMYAQHAMLAAGFQGCQTVWDSTSVVELSGSWQSYWSARKGAWLRRFRRAENRLAQQGEISFVRYRPLARISHQSGKSSDRVPLLARPAVPSVTHCPALLDEPAVAPTGEKCGLGESQGDGSPRWDLYDACEELARRSWQGAATDGTTLSHDAVRNFLREAHQTAAAAGAVDLSLLSIGGRPAAFVYGYQYGGYVSGLRRGYDAERSREGAGNVLLAYTLRDSFARGDRIYDLGVGSLESKRHFQTRLLPILRFSHFPLLPMRTQLLRIKRWWQRCPASIAAGRAQD